MAKIFERQGLHLLAYLIPGAIRHESESGRGWGMSTLAPVYGEAAA